MSRIQKVQLLKILAKMGCHFFVCMSNPGTVRFTSSKNLFLFGSHRIRGFEGMKHGHRISHLYLESFYWP